jgi:uncharacterized protein YlxP (DUF503 family)
MVVGVCRLQIGIPETGSLKGKRSVVKRIIGRTQQKFNVAIAEVDDLDLWQRATLGFAVVGNEQSFVNSMVDKILDFIERLELAELLDQEMEFLQY